MWGECCSGPQCTSADKTRAGLPQQGFFLVGKEFPLEQTWAWGQTSMGRKIRVSGFPRPAHVLCPLSWPGVLSQQWTSFYKHLSWTYHRSRTVLDMKNSDITKHRSFHRALEITWLLLIIKKQENRRLGEFNTNLHLFIVTDCFLKSDFWNDH